MRIASWNVNSLNVRMPHLQEWLRLRAPDVVALQETKMEDAKFPDTALVEQGYRSVFCGQKTYNGVAILSKLPASEVQLGIPGFEDEQKRAIAATVRGIRIVNLYVVNGQSVGSEKYDYKLRWFRAVHDWLDGELQRHPQLVVMGDFNIAPEDRDTHDPAIWNEDSIHSSTAERAALQKLLGLGLYDSFRLQNEQAGQFSWWDYRAAGFRRDRGLRIDLVLVSEALKARTIGAHIDREPRLWDRPSDHAPVWVDLAD
ncbi:MAG: exodeoxyribonuclease III [Arenimonas sp.]